MGPVLRHTHIRPFRTLGLVTAGLLVLILAPPAGAETVAVDPGDTVSSGKAITGSSQNLPSMDSSDIWDLGSYPAASVDAYYSSGAAERDRREVARAALTWTRNWVRETCGGTAPEKVRACRAAAVFDVDDTLVDWYPTLSKAEPAFTYDATLSDEVIVTCGTPVLSSTRALYRSLRKMGVTVFLITGRPEAQREASATCLRSLGINGWQDFILRPTGDSSSAAVYKSQARKGLEKKGWRIGPSIGDQVSDMSLGRLGHGFLVPNLMYFIP